MGSNELPPTDVFSTENMSDDKIQATIASMNAVSLLLRASPPRSRNALIRRCYLWDEYTEAQQQRDDVRLQELELRCDGIALIAMNRHGIDAGRLVSAATKLARYNERVMGTTTDPRYVPLDQRVRFIRSVARITATSAPVLGRREK
jgi:hypothetical protein